MYLQQDRLTSFLERADDQERFNVVSELVGAGRLNDLQNQLEKESRSWTKQTSKLREEGAAALTRVNNLKSQLERLEQASSLGEKLDESSWDEWWQVAKKFEVSVTELPSSTSPDSNSLLDRTIRELQASRDQLQRKSSVISTTCLLYTSPSPRDLSTSRMPSSA